ncbi:hypothetical protein MBLNU457_6733t1 [Dothideomycetes sp. NU457]
MLSSIAVTALSAAALLPAPVAAFWRMPCGSRLLDQRMDPIIFPGIVSPHVHQLVGGNGLGYTENFDTARESTCSSCPITADLSNYWTPTLYYQYQNGSFVKVPQVGDGSGNLGGMNVYYLQRGPGSEVTPVTLKAFPPGFRMVAGDPFKRNYTDNFQSQAVSFVCLDYNGPAKPETNALPTYSCPDGVRAQVFFPSCWDGVNLDTPDHMSHMAYPESGAYNGGPCPASHPVQLISLFFEVLFNTDQFDFWSGSYGTGQPFVFAMGDPTGYGFHGDFINGWDVDVLQAATTDCMDDSGNISDCPHFQVFSAEEQQACKLPTTVHEDITGPFNALPGCNPVSAGPGEASPASCSTPAIGAPILGYTDVSSTLKWAYQGCTPDGSTRTLTGFNNVYGGMSAPVTVESCIQECESQGYLYAGMEYSSQCFCGNSIPSSVTPTAFGQCNMPCAGNSSETCGGPNLLSLYKTCNTTSSCTNIAYTPVGDILGGENLPQTSVIAGASPPVATSISVDPSVASSAAAAQSSQNAALGITVANKGHQPVAVTSASSSQTVKSATSAVRSSSSSAVSSSAVCAAASTITDKVTVTVTETVTAAPLSKRAGNARSHLAQHKHNARHE